jgi:imidazolonepropionase-like amidohydrolase
MAERGTVYVPTLWGFSDDSGIDLETLAASEAEAVRHWRAEHRMSVQRAVSAGVTVAAGSDAAGWLPPADVLRRELAALAACGLDNVDLLSAATLGAATALGESGTLGVVAPGAVADLLVLAEDPHTDLDSLADPQLVISRGRPAGDGWEPDRALAATATTERWVDP